MLFIRSFINLIVVPVVAFYIFYKKNGKAFKLNFEAVLFWAILVACNIPVTRLFTFIVRKTTGINVEADSSYYTVAALVAAALLPLIFDLGKRIYGALDEDEKADDRRIIKHDKDEYKNKLYP